MSEGLKKSIGDIETFVNESKGQNSALSTSFRDVAEMGVGDLRKEIKLLQKESIVGKSPEQILALNMRIGELTDSMGDLKAMQRGLGTEFGSLATKGIQGFAGLAEAGLGVAMVFGMDEKQAQKMQTTMIATMGAVQGLGEFQSMLGDKVLQSIAIRVKETAVTYAQAVATGVATAAQWLYNASLIVVIATIGAAVVVVGAIVATIYMLVKGHDEAADAAERQSLAELNLSRSLTEGIHKNEQMLKLAKARGASAQELKQLEIGSAQQHLLGLKKILDAQLDVNGVMKKGVDSEARQKMKDEFIAVSEAQEVMIVELKNMSTTSQEVTPKIVQNVKTVRDAWVEAYEAAQKLAQFDVPQWSPQRQPDQPDMKPVAGKKDIGAGADAAILEGLKKKQAVRRKFEKAEQDDAKKLAQTKLAYDMETRETNLSSLADSFGKSAALFGENTIAYKGMAIAQASISTWLAGATILANQAKLGPVVMMASFATTIATGLMTVGKIAGAFANGGIVGGSSYSGDALTANVNSAEMILNQSQQGQLFALANGRGGGGGELTTRVSGSDLVFVLNNHAKKIKNTR